VPFLPTSSSTTVKDFVAKYQAKYNAKPDLFAAEAYDATVVLMDGIKAAGSDNAEAVRAAIGKLKDIPAATGSVSYQGGPDNTTPHYTLVKVEGGAFVELK
jgi:branched-chain amino acid transport system substrate-binding protein